MGGFADSWDDGNVYVKGGDVVSGDIRKKVTDNINDNIGIYLIVFMLFILYYFRKDVNAASKDIGENSNLISNFLAGYI
jgi:hypothetical protein